MPFVSQQNLWNVLRCVNIWECMHYIPVRMCVCFWGCVCAACVIFSTQCKTGVGGYTYWKVSNEEETATFSPLGGKQLQLFKSKSDTGLPKQRAWQRFEIIARGFCEEKTHRQGKVFFFFFVCCVIVTELFLCLYSGCARLELCVVGY